MVTDMLDREIKIGDFVVFYANIYKVLALSRGRNGYGDVKIELISKSATTKPVKKPSKDMCIVDTGAVLFWILKKD